jgi:hypothetical protein
LREGASCLSMKRSTWLWRMRKRSPRAAPSRPLHRRRGLDRTARGDRRRGRACLSPWQEWQGSVFVRVRLRSLAPIETAANGQFERTGVNGRERSLALAMQKVEGSSPFIRSLEPAGTGGFFLRLEQPSQPYSARP